MSVALESRLKQGWSALLDIVYPKGCVHCGLPIVNSEYDWICASCADYLEVVQPPACKTCGYPFFGAIAIEHSCPHCIELDPVFNEGRTLLLHKGPARSLVHALKYQSAKFVIQDISRIIASIEQMDEWLSDTTLVPIPLHKRRQRQRGFNQSELLACRVSDLTDCPVQHLLERTRNTAKQTRLNREQRERNVAKAFTLKKGVKVDSSSTYVLVDDVFTTGATLNAAARALSQADARKIKVLTLAHG